MEQRGKLLHFVMSEPVVSISRKGNNPPKQFFFFFLRACSLSSRIHTPHPSLVTHTLSHTYTLLSPPPRLVTHKLYLSVFLTVIMVLVENGEFAEELENLNAIFGDDVPMKTTRDAVELTIMPDIDIDECFVRCDLVCLVCFFF